ncbi:beta-tubulin [Reticulomyxa filosa]|uniref:Beta-tubulin n=1 Tax=Reticulomyxa filosa TaxID=46433 RepID=X6N6T4_RETFI|nr:beta-tubulin [Reticulomyxa filosa]|eukprot:ETO21975.1 beta-tubulin [Reticulomyxa filosa]
MGHEFWKHLNEEAILNVSGEPEENHPFHETQIDEFQEKDLNRYDYELQIFTKRRVVERNKVLASEHGKLFDPDSFITSRGGTGSLFAVGHYTDGAYQIRSILEMLRKELEGCDAPLAFSLGHSLSGGTGSGLGTLILTRLADEFTDVLRVSQSVFPSPGMAGDQNLAPFNSLCAFNMLAEFCDQVYLFDNSALNNCLSTYLRLEKPELKDLNRLLAYVQCHVTSPMRYPGKLASDLRKMGTNLIPFPRLKFLGLSQSPICFEFDLRNEVITFKLFFFFLKKKKKKNQLRTQNNLYTLCN